MVNDERTIVDKIKLDPKSDDPNTFLSLTVYSDGGPISIAVGYYAADPKEVKSDAADPKEVKSEGIKKSCPFYTCSYTFSADPFFFKQDRYIASGVVLLRSPDKQQEEILSLTILFTNVWASSKATCRVYLTAPFRRDKDPLKKELISEKISKKLEEVKDTKSVILSISFRT